MADTASHGIDDPANRSTFRPHDERIGRALARLEHAVESKPGFGRSTSLSTTTLVDGLRCETREGGHLVTTDLVAALGGSDAGPSPSALLRAALGACLTMGYRLRAARHRIPVDRIKVVVETDSELGGMLHPEFHFPPGFVGVRYRVDIAGPGPTAVTDGLIDEADRLSPVLDTLNRPMPVDRVPSGRTAREGDR